MWKLVGLTKEEKLGRPFVVCEKCAGMACQNVRNDFEGAHFGPNNGNGHFVPLNWNPGLGGSLLPVGNGRLGSTSGPGSDGLSDSDNEDPRYES